MYVVDIKLQHVTTNPGLYCKLNISFKKNKKNKLSIANHLRITKPKRGPNPEQRLITIGPSGVTSLHESDVSHLALTVEESLATL